MELTENEISYSLYCQLGGSQNGDLRVKIWNNGKYHYITYHYVGDGQASWKQDLPA